MILKSFLLLISFIFPTLSFAGTCQTSSGLNFECGNTENMLEAILLNMVQDEETSVRYFSTDEETQEVSELQIKRYPFSEDSSDSYIQAYISSSDGNSFSRIHFVKIKEYSYNVYLEANIHSTEQFENDSALISNEVHLLGVAKNTFFTGTGDLKASIDLSDFYQEDGSTAKKTVSFFYSDRSGVISFSIPSLGPQKFLKEGREPLPESEAQPAPHPGGGL